jgi:hypothetical protein
MEMKPLINHPFDLKLETQYTVRVVKDDPVQAIPCLFVSLKAPSTTTYAATVFCPSEYKNARFTLDESGRNPVIRYNLNGKEYAYEFGEDKVGSLK